MPDTQTTNQDTKNKGFNTGVFQRLTHDSASRHVTGEAVYIDDMSELDGTLHVQVGLSTRAHAKILEMNLEAVKNAPGVIAVLTASDVTGVNDFGHACVGDDRVFADGIVEFYGQAIFCVAAETYAAGRAAVRLAEIKYENLVPVLSIENALATKSYVAPEKMLEQGDARFILGTAKNRLKGSVSCGGQEHFYLEPQVSLAIPKEEGDVHVYCATQDPSAVQHLLARVIGKPANSVTVEVRRMGGGFGGKETLPTQFASIAALTALKTGRPAKCRLDRDDDMLITGKRHGMQFKYDVGFDDTGRIQAIDFQILADSGYSQDQSPQIIQRAMFHSDGAYYLENAHIEGHPLKTNKCTGCAFRGFGSPQALLGIERVLDEISFYLRKEPLDIRKANLYGQKDRNVSLSGQLIDDNILPRLLEELEESSEYAARRKSVKAFNAESPWVKRGIAFMPLKFGVGFSSKFLNQAGALIHIYQDGSIHLNHGGTEMGQGLYVKVAQIVAEEFNVDIDTIKITSTVTDKVPNTTSTAASSGTDMNGAAAQIAAQEIKGRLIEFAAEHYKVDANRIVFEQGKVKIGNISVSFPELVNEAYMNLVSLSATGYYKNPDIGVDPLTNNGRPYHYNVYSGAVVEVAIDTLTGESKVLRIDILHDAGKSLNPAIDIGQIEGGFVQGMGWLTCEELVWNENGALTTHAPSTYKIPVSSDCPENFRVKLIEWNENTQETVYRSKAIGEPPLNLAVSVFNAITDAVSSVAEYRYCPDLNAPATPEAILMACEDLRDRIRRDQPG